MNPAQGRIDAQTGKAFGPVPEIVEALAKTIDVPFKIISSPNAAGIASALDKREADIGVLAYDVERTRDVDYGAPLLVMFNSYLVPADSSIRRSSDVDRAGVTVAAVRGQTQELFVSSHLKNAKIRVFETMPPQAEVEALLAGATRPSTCLPSTGSVRFKPRRRREKSSARSPTASSTSISRSWCGKGIARSCRFSNSSPGTFEGRA